MKKPRKQASRENGAPRGGARRAPSPRRSRGAACGVADNEGGEDVAPTLPATNMPWPDGHGGGAAAEPPEAADDMAEERNAAALTEEGAPEASATSTTSGGDDVAPAFSATNVGASEPLKVTDERNANAIVHAIAGALTEEGAAVALDARSAGEIAEVADASSQVGLAPLSPYGALALANAFIELKIWRDRNARAIETALSECIIIEDERDKQHNKEEEQGKYDAEWEAAWENKRESEGQEKGSGVGKGAGAGEGEGKANGSGMGKGDGEDARAGAGAGAGASALPGAIGAGNVPGARRKKPHMGRNLVRR